MADRLSLKDTVGPPAGYDGYWGYASLSARDTVTMYRYLLDSAPAAVRDFVMGNLRQSTRCASDGFDQHFGIAGTFEKPWAIKQGWAGSSYEEGTCGPPGTAAAAPRTADRATASCAQAQADQAQAAHAQAAKAPAQHQQNQAVAAVAADVDLTRPALHSTGTVGAGDRFVVAVFTLHPVGTSYGKAFTDIGRLTRSLDVPGVARSAGWWYGTWSSHVNVRRDPSTRNALITQLPAGAEVLVGCQARGRRCRCRRTPMTGGLICLSTAAGSPTSSSARPATGCRTSRAADRGGPQRLLSPADVRGCWARLREAWVVRSWPSPHRS